MKVSVDCDNIKCEYNTNNPDNPDYDENEEDCGHCDADEIELDKNGMCQSEL